VTRIVVLLCGLWFSEKMTLMAGSKSADCCVVGLMSYFACHVTLICVIWNMNTWPLS